MQLRYDEDLLEGAAFLCARGRRPGVPALQIARFNREREKLYRVLDPDERNAAFFNLHFAWFREWGLEKLLADRLKEFPLLPGALTTLAFRKARAKNEEGAELYVNQETSASFPTPHPTFGHPLPSFDEGRGQGEGSSSESQGARISMRGAMSRHGVVALRPENFERDDDLARFLRHELTHLHDMVDPAFGYSPNIASSVFNTAQQRLTRERYRLLWDITIDGRLSTHGHLSNGVRDKHDAAFRRAYSFWADEQRRAVFDELWTDAAPRHERLLALASDPKAVSHAHQPLPGAACPLCGFPTFDWADATSLGPIVQERIAGEFPHWLPEHGACGRCAEIYRVLVKTELPANLCV